MESGNRLLFILHRAILVSSDMRYARKVKPAFIEQYSCLLP